MPLGSYHVKGARSLHSIFLSYSKWDKIVNWTYYCFEKHLMSLKGKDKAYGERWYVSLDQLIEKPDELLAMQAFS